MNDIYKIIQELNKITNLSYKKFRKILSRYPKQGNKIYSKNEILERYRSFVEGNKIKKSLRLEKFLQLKPTRTISGVAPITVLTKPYKCPGRCIFCPTDINEPKSYLSTEPGAMRARMLNFDPYIETKVRVKALENIGHNTEKIELIILGGTWSYYPRNYQMWFILNCFKAMNNSQPYKELEKNIEILKKELIREQFLNETSKHRNVGLVIETRPDFINKEEVKWLRFLGCTKVQLGVQSLDNKILKLNKRDHKVSDIKRAISILRLSGFKIHLHWMLNLYGSNVQDDIKYFKLLFKDKAIRPDELKIYPCLLLKGTELYEIYKKGNYKPYTKKELLNILIECKNSIPKYVRISRVFRDIPSFEIVEGVKETNFREIVIKEMKNRELVCKCIRCREIKDRNINIADLKFEIIKYNTNVSYEYFLSMITQDNKIVGFLRLTLPFRKYSSKHFMIELKDSAIIREVHVYGISARIMTKGNETNVQHKGIGSLLIRKAENISRKNNFGEIVVISAIGTRMYYRKLGYKLENLYMFKNL